MLHQQEGHQPGVTPAGEALLLVTPAGEALLLVTPAGGTSTRVTHQEGHQSGLHTRRDMCTPLHQQEGHVHPVTPAGGIYQGSTTVRGIYPGMYNGERDGAPTGGWERGTVHLREGGRDAPIYPGGPRWVYTSPYTPPGLYSRCTSLLPVCRLGTYLVGTLPDTACVCRFDPVIKERSVLYLGFKKRDLRD